MKKTYTKPVIMFESFVLSTNIAAGCDFEANLTRGSCGLVIRGRVVFADSTMGCTMEVPYDVSNQDYIYNNQICYHVPNNDSNLFNS